MNQTMTTGQRRRVGAFTLIEVLASMAVLVVIMLMLMRVFNEASGSFNRSNNIVSRTASARAAMELITRDLEGAIVDNRFGMYKESSTFFTNYDQICFATVSGSPDDGRAVQLVQYYVTQEYDQTSNFTNFVLKRAVRELGVTMGTPINGDALAPNLHDWWNRNLTGFEHLTVIGNVVRFDIFVCVPGGQHLSDFMSGLPLGGNGYYSSFKDMPASADPKSHPAPPGGMYPSNSPPAYVEVYLQVTSDDTMKKASLLLARMGNNAQEKDLFRKGLSMIYQDSSVLMARIFPIMGPWERQHPLTY